MPARSSYLRGALLASCAAALLLASARSAPAQGRPTRFQPTRPTVSPYLNLFRRDAGPLPNYHTLVRPQLQQRAFNQQLEQSLLGQGQAVRQLSQQINQIQTSGAAPTGIGASFGNTMQYYPGRPQR